VKLSYSDGRVGDDFDDFDDSLNSSQNLIQLLDITMTDKEEMIEKKIMKVFYWEKPKITLLLYIIMMLPSFLIQYDISIISCFFIMLISTTLFFLVYKKILKNEKHQYERMDKYLIDNRSEITQYFIANVNKLIFIYYSLFVERNTVFMFKFIIMLFSVLYIGISLSWNLLYKIFVSFLFLQFFLKKFKI
jgi:hypothetical protein